jgi:hypothetical protein
MKVIIQGTPAEINALRFRLPNPTVVPLRFELLIPDLINVRLRRDPYSDAYRLTADLDTREGTV